MASWVYKSFVTQLFGVRHPAILADKIYYVDSQSIYVGGPTQNPGGDIYELDPAGPTTSMILDASTFAGGEVEKVWSLAAFGGNLYAAIDVETIPNTEAENRVYRWDGTPGNWTQVASEAAVESQYPKYARLYAGTGVLLWYISGQGTDTGFVQYSSDGSSWSGGGISGQEGTLTEIEFDFTVYWPLGIYEAICVNRTAATCNDSSVYTYSGGSLVTYQASPADVFLQSSPNGNIHFGGGGFYKMALDLSTADLLDADIGALMLMNAVAKQIGVDGQITQSVLYEFNGTAWVELETMTQSLGVDPFFQAGGGWIANGTSKAWLLGENDSTGNWELWERSEAFATPTATLAEFWYGVNTPVYKSDLPFGGVNPGAMAINPAGNVAVVGGDEAGGQIVAYSPADFTAWTNMSGGMATGSAVTSVKYV